MVVLRSFLPDPGSIEALAQLRAPLVVTRLDKPIGGVTRLFLSTDNNFRVSLVVDYHTVAFKFEVFELVVDPSMPTAISNTLEVAHIRGWDLITCLFRFEWQRPAKPEELPSHYDQIVGERGERHEVPSNALDVAVSLVGLAFGNEGRAIAAIIIDDEDPIALRVYDEPKEIEMAIRGCEKVRLEDVNAWASQLRDLQVGTT